MGPTHLESERSALAHNGGRFLSMVYSVCGLNAEAPPVQAHAVALPSCIAIQVLAAGKSIPKNVGRRIIVSQKTK